VYSPIDANTSAASNSTTLSVVGSNCWIVAVEGEPNANAGAGFTLRVATGSGGYYSCLEDSNTAVSAGNNTVSFSAGSVIACASFNIKPSTLYWVGGTGTWDTSTATHWALTSGGTGGKGVPDSTTSVVFDASSGGGTVTTSGTLSCVSVTTTGFTGAIIVGGALTTSGDFWWTSAGQYLTINAALTIGGNLTVAYTPGGVGININVATIVSGNVLLDTTTTIGGAAAFSIGGNFYIGGSATNSYVGAITFTSTSSGKTITCNGITLNSPIVFNGVGGVWTLQDTLTVGSYYSLTITNGTLNTNGKSVTTGSLSNAGTLTLGSSTVTIYGNGTTWSCTGTLNAGTSSIQIYDNAITSNTITFNGQGKTYNQVAFSGTGTGAFIVQGNNVFNDFKCDTPPHTIQFTAGTTQTLQTFTVSGTSWPIGSTGLVSYYNLNANSNDCVGSNNGTDTDISYATAGKIGNCATFNGTTSIVIYSDKIIPSGAKSIAFWAKTSNDGSQYPVIIENGNRFADNNGTTIMMYNTGKLWFFVRKLGSNLIFQIASTIAINDGAWHHFVCVWDGTTSTNGAKLYVDGSLDKQATATSTDTTASNNLLMGRSTDGSGFWDGSIDEFSIWSKVLTPAEITSLYNAGTGVTFAMMILKSTSSGTPWRLIKSTSGNISRDYLSLQDSHVSSL
jgi:hypothetical protein